MTATECSILLVDDRPENLLALEAVLEPLGLRLVPAGSGTEALRHLLHEDFALILLDVQMPDFDGYELAELIRAREKTRHVPIIFLTAISPEDRHAFRGYEAGAVDFLFKPFEPMILRSKVSVFVDLHRLKLRAESLAQRALHDSLTGLPNRVLFHDRLGLGLSRMSRDLKPLAVLFVDIDGLKAVNDGLGHQVGDALLIEVAARLQGAARPTDTAARLGGDEFTLLCEGLSDAEDAARIAERVQETMALPFALAEATVAVGASIGITIAHDPDRTPSDLLHEADTAMYRVKERGGGGYELYDEALRVKVSERIATEKALHHALDNGQFRLFYQPVVSFSTGMITGTEALLRWEHPERGLVAPGEFIPLAEKTGLIIPIGRWVLEEACRQSERWRAMLPEATTLRMSVNLSVRQLADPILSDVVAKVIAASGADPHAICLEITESAIMDDPESAGLILQALKQVGVSLAVDDFGTGHSSLSYLQRFPVSILKVDRSFIGSLEQDPQNRAIAGAIIGLAHALGMEALAEGIETPAQIAELQLLGCDSAQGFHFSRPQPAEAITSMLVAAKKWNVGNHDGNGSRPAPVASNSGLAR